jgi:hypothetical protein
MDSQALIFRFSITLYGITFVEVQTKDFTHVQKSYRTPFSLHNALYEVILLLKNCVFWDITPCGSCKNRRFGGTLRLLHQGENNLLP